jgi:hypothetical protein
VLIVLKYLANLPILWFGLGCCVHAAPPILRFPDGISWKAAFDAGFRPKHIPGLEKDTTECRNQPLRFELEGSSEPFILDPGRLSIELRPDDSVRLFMHTSHIPISMEEGERRLMTFRRIFDKHLIRKGWMPPVMDERGSVMTSSEQGAAARIGVYGFTFGFTGTSNKDYPLIPRFQLAWVGTGRENTSNIRRKIVTPPAGYEWYSMDPKVHTPDPGSDEEAKNVDPLPEATGRPERRPRGESAESPQPGYAPVEAARPPRWGAWILLALGGLGFVVWRWTRRTV